MCKDLQENKVNKMKFHEEMDQFIEQFKGQIIGQYFQYWIEVDMISKLRIMMNTLHFVMLNWRRKSLSASSMQIAGTKKINFNI